MLNEGYTQVNWLEQKREVVLGSHLLYFAFFAIARTFTQEKPLGSEGLWQRHSPECFMEGAVNGCKVMPCFQAVEQLTKPSLIVSFGEACPLFKLSSKMHFKALQRWVKGEPLYSWKLSLWCNQGGNKGLSSIRLAKEHSQFKSICSACTLTFIF